MRANSKAIKATGARRVDADAQLLKLYPRYLAASALAARYDTTAKKGEPSEADGRAEDRAIARMMALRDQIYCLRPRTAAGVRIKAQVLVDEYSINKLDKNADAFERGLRTLASDTASLLTDRTGVVVVSRAVLSALSAHAKARAKVERFMARRVDRPGDDPKMNSLCEAEDRATWALLKVKPVSAADVGLILGRVGAFSSAGHMLPSRAARKGEKAGSVDFVDDLIRAAAAWLDRLERGEGLS